MSEENNAAAGVANDASSRRFFKLPDFWVSSPVAWFGVVESQFTMRGITSQADRFGLVTAVLPESSARKVSHLLADPSDTCYDDLRRALLSTHELTEMQKMDNLFNMDPLGGHRPMDLLTEMLELVKPGEEKTQLFAMLFLRRLPAAVRVLLTEDDYTDLRALAEKADRCAASLARQGQEVGHPVAAVAPQPEADTDNEDDGVVAAAFGRRPSQQRLPSQQQNWRKQQPKKTGGGRAAKPSRESVVDQAAAAAGICFYHYLHGKAAQRCRQPCNWVSGN